MTPKIRQAYASQKFTAKRRGISFSLSFEEWLTVWQRSGKFHLRGRGSDKFCMARVGDKGAYQQGNILIITNRENVSQMNRFGRVQSAATRRKISRAKKGVKLSKAHRRAISLGHIGLERTAEHRANIAKAHVGMRYSLATRKKVSRARKAYYRKLRQEQCAQL